MIEVFVGFTKDSPIKLLEETLEAWNLDGLEPVATNIEGRKFELLRRVAAENMSRGDYILTELGYGPIEENFAHECGKLITLQPKAGLFAIMPMDGLPPSHWGKVTLCRKGVVTKWPTPRSAAYLEEHTAAARLNGFEAQQCKLHYQVLLGSLPS
jgi:hypothetical protein